MRVLTIASLPSQPQMSQLRWQQPRWQRLVAEQHNCEQRNARRLASLLIVLTIAGTAIGVCL